MSELLIQIVGLEPVQQGSKTMAPKRGSRPCRVCKRRPMVLVDAADMSNKSGANRLKIFRHKVVMESRKQAVRQRWKPLKEGGVELAISLSYQRPESHLKKDRTLRKGKPLHKVSKPDLDKLLRAINDALTAAGIFSDDSQVVTVNISKSYAKEGQVPGIGIAVREAVE